LEKMAEIEKLPEADRTLKTQDLMGYIADNIPVTWKEKLSTSFDSYRYTNMLSGPQTHERNLYQNLFNTLITRPADLAFEATYDIVKHPFNPLARNVSFSDVPKYYKNLATTLPDAIVAAKEAFKGNFSPKFMESQVGSSAILNARKQGMTPKALKTIPSVLEAQDKFFSSLISQGEYNRLIKNGVSEAQAKTAAQKIAEEYLVRTKLGDNKANPVAVRALDGLGQLMESMRKIPVVGEGAKWFIPFVQTPVNVAKMMVSHSPIGFIGGSMDSSQLAKATTGSVALATGAFMALQGRTTWAAPSDPKQKELFYASGRQPYSLNIGGKWVPMWYFGPYALSLALPAAMRDAQSDSRTALTDDTADKMLNVISGAMKFLASQTPMQGTAGFFRMIDGDIDYSAKGLAAGMAGQTIPLESFVRWVNGFVDPVYRKGNGVIETLEKGIPGLSKNLEPYTNPGLTYKDQKTPSKKELLNQFLPYRVTTPNKAYEPALDKRKDELQQNAIINQQKKAGTYQTLAQLKYEEYKKLKKENPTQATKLLTDIKNDPSNPSLYSQMKSLAEDERAAVSKEEKKLREMNIQDRAEALALELKNYPKGSKGRADVVNRWKEVGILTDNVYQLLLKMQEEGKF